jgi:hypothetical protein
VLEDGERSSVCRYPIGRLTAGDVRNPMANLAGDRSILAGRYSLSERPEIGVQDHADLLAPGRHCRSSDEETQQQGFSIGGRVLATHPGPASGDAVCTKEQWPQR